MLLLQRAVLALSWAGVAWGLAACSQATQQPEQAAQPSVAADSAAAVVEPGEAQAQETPGAAAHEHAEESTAAPRPNHAHSDHDSKHGGTFFMALDNKHHLEGVLRPPGVFQIYLYDEYTRPVSRAVLEQTEGTVEWGETEDAPKSAVKVSQDGTVLEASYPGALRFPITLTLLMRFPGSSPDAKRELFTFPFSHYTGRDRAAP
jgi:hypothetical protein